jgi:endonuclease YncB( thermonuclease family)
MNSEYIDFNNHDINNTSYFSLNGIKTYARLIDVYDGDTIICILPFFNNFYKFHVRLNDLDTCEIKSKNEELKNLALLARHKILDLVCKDNKLDLHCTRKEIQNYLSEDVYTVWLECLSFDKYGRLLANVYENKESIYSFSTILINLHLGYHYDGGTKLSEKEQKEHLN